MSASTPCIVIDHELPDGMMNGMGADGELIVSMRYMPKFERLVGTQDDESEVHTWRVSADSARRIAAISAWNSYEAPDHPTAGSA